MKYNVHYYVNNGEGKTEAIRGTVEFSYNPDTYGNGYYMGIKSTAEAFGFQSYDIRYDRRFDKNHMIPYIVQYFDDRYDGLEGRWKLIGIRVFEGDE